jgi:hypothetical protein
MTSFALKIIALTAMVIDHAGAIFPDTGIWFRVIGRAAFPLFAFLAAEGALHTRSRARYLLRLGFFAVISQVPYYIAFHRGFLDFSDEPSWRVSFLADTNVLYTLFLGVLACAVMKGLKSYFPGVKYQLLRVALYVLVMAAAALTAGYLRSDFGIVGVLMVALAYLTPHKWGKLAVIAGGVAILNSPVGLWLSSFTRLNFYGKAWPGYGELMLPAACTALLLIALYNGKRGQGMKWMFYAAYPLHIVLLMLIATVMGIAQFVYL